MHDRKGNRYFHASANILANPKVGDKLPGHYIGKMTKSGRYQLHEYVVCSDCGEGRWVVGIKTPSPFCLKCRIGPNNPQWKGGVKIQYGYRLIAISPDSPYFTMAHGVDKPRLGWGYILEHRLVMAQHLGRYLESWEHVHHRDANRLNNDISNLYITDAATHHEITRMQAQIDKLTEEVALLRKEIKLQAWHIREIEKEKEAR